MNIEKELRRRLNAAGSQTALAKELGVSLPYLNDVLRGRREPGESILRPLGARRVVTYRKREDGGSR